MQSGDSAVEVRDIAEERTLPSKLGIAGLSPFSRSHFKALTFVDVFSFQAIFMVLSPHVSKISPV